LTVSDSQSSASASRFADVAYGGKELQLEYTWVLPDNPGPLIVFLHEGLGSLQMWRGFPHALCAAVGCRGMVYSRCGYGASTPLWPDGNWPVEFMHTEAREILPRFLAAVDVDTTRNPPVLLGHSDGASVALIYACSFPDKLSGLIAAAPHIFVEDITVASIAQTRQRFMDTDLPQRLKKYHRNVDHAFWGWANVWLRPDFLYWTIEALLRNLACPTLLVQGWEDQYGTMRQVDHIAAAANLVRMLKLADCGHSPHVDQRDAFIAAVADYFLYLDQLRRADLSLR
jgi:pimeloyl-ACP methyl ester carboxylesterase